MTKHKQAMKRHRQNLKRRERNKHVKSTVRSSMKKVLDTVKANSPNEAVESLKKAQSNLSDAGRKRILHPRAAARKTGRLAKKVNSLLKQQST